MGVKWTRALASASCPVSARVTSKLRLANPGGPPVLRNLEIGQTGKSLFAGMFSQLKYFTKILIVFAKYKYKQNTIQIVPLLSTDAMWVLPALLAYLRYHLVGSPCWLVHLRVSVSYGNKVSNTVI